MKRTLSSCLHISQFPALPTKFRQNRPENESVRGDKTVTPLWKMKVISTTSRHEDKSCLTSAEHHLVIQCLQRQRVSLSEGEFLWQRLLWHENGLNLEIKRAFYIYCTLF